MTLNKQITYLNKTYSHITDDFRESKSHTLYLQTKQNTPFIKDSISKTDIIQTSDLSNIFDIKPKIIGITGTNGKTTSAAIVYSILLDLGYSVALLGTRGFYINNQNIKPKGLTTPSILELYEDLELAKECEFFIMEVSSHAIEQNRIGELKFIIKALTNITQDHLDYHKSIEEYVRVKNSFLDDAKYGGISVVNSDENNAVKNRDFYYYGVESKGVSKHGIYVDAYTLKGAITAHISLKDATNSSDATFSSSLVGKHNLYNLLLAVYIVSLATQKPLNQICECVGGFGGVEGRAEVVSKEPLVVVDFAHTPDGFVKIFESFLWAKMVVVFGAGGDRDKSKRPKMATIAQKYATKIYITSDNPRSEDPESIIKDILQGISDIQKVSVDKDRKASIHKALANLQNDEILLILGKGDETYQIIGTQKLHFDDREIVREWIKEHKDNH